MAAIPGFLAGFPQGFFSGVQNLLLANFCFYANFAIMLSQTLGGKSLSGVGKWFEGGRLVEESQL